MNKKIMRLPLLLSISALFLSACGGSGHDDGDTLSSSYQVSYASSNVYNAIKADAAAAQLFNSVDVTATSLGLSTALCDVKIVRMTYDTIGSAGEAATSSGVVMIPKEPTSGDVNPLCKGKRPTVLYAHGTTDDSRYDLSQFIANPDNPATLEAMVLLATYASRGFNVIAPNYAGYSDSSLSYHPYLDQKQQSTEMIDAYDFVRNNSSDIEISMSGDLFVTGLSQGGYVAMATHKALEAKGETVKASLPISGPYAMLDFVDTVFAGYVNGGATIFAPMLLTAMDKAHNIYSDPAEVYSSTYVSTAETSLPRIGGLEKAVEGGLLPAKAIFSGVAPTLDPPLQSFQVDGFGSPHLLADSFRTSYRTDAFTNGASPVYKIRSLIKDADLRDWTPKAPVLMCGANTDPVVYHSNSNNMASYWESNGGLVTAGLIINLDLTETPAGLFESAQTAWQAAGISPESVHAQTGPYCSAAGLGYFLSLLSN